MSPMMWKQDVIITLFKGGNKRKDGPENYRVITLVRLAPVWNISVKFNNENQWSY